jgi:hypothetical protein
MKYILFLILFNTVSVFSQIVSFKADTLFMDGDIYLVDNIDYQVNLYDSTIITSEVKKEVRISYFIKDGIIYINDDIELRIINNHRLNVVYKNSRKEDDFYYSGKFKLNINKN